MKLKFLTTGVVRGSVYLAGAVVDLPDDTAQACLAKGLAEVVPVAVETEPPAADPETTPVFPASTPGKKRKGA